MNDTPTPSTTGSSADPHPPREATVPRDDPEANSTSAPATNDSASPAGAAYSPPPGLTQGFSSRLLRERFDREWDVTPAPYRLNGSFWDRKPLFIKAGDNDTFAAFLNTTEGARNVSVAILVPEGWRIESGLTMFAGDMTPPGRNVTATLVVEDPGLYVVDVVYKKGEHELQRFSIYYDVAQA